LSEILYGNNLETLKTIESCSINCCVTSPPYFGLRDYGLPSVKFADGWKGEHGKEETVELYVNHEVEVFREVYRVLRDDGTLWLNLGDSYCSSNGYARSQSAFQRKGRNDAPANDINLSKPHEEGIKTKDLIGIPWHVAFALQSDGWYLRQDIIWAKSNPMPESVTDRCTKSHEYIFLFAKSEKYYFDNDSIKEPCTTFDEIVRDRDNSRLNNVPGRSRMGGLKCNNYTMKNKRDVWNVSAKPFNEAHFATFPPELIEPCILAGCPEGGIVLDPFGGSGTTGMVAMKNRREYILCELNKEYIKIAEKRIGSTQINLI
jgi:DNA modification methylase